MLPTKTEISFQANKMLNVLVEFAKTEYDLNVEDIDFVLRFRDCSRFGCAGSSASGRPEMNLNVGALLKGEPHAFIEYRSFNRETRIGGFDTTDWKLWLDTLIVHEFAHVIQYALKNRPSNLRESKYYWDMKKGRQHFYFTGFGYFETGHKDFFKRIYMVLRKRFINDRVTTRVGYTSFDSHFAREDRTPPREAKYDATHPHVGKTVAYMGREYKVVAFKAANRKYPLIGECNGHRVKFPLYMLAK